ncbi:DGAT1/2-independent enzyme synthesizing storage lipids-like [Tiliqua scincoides]|uniref:DGAT1/2-independent enzyme synthesizing storage lipids-like n=1 Tax=Tiliqua scincoides TaxID=71010 RepID=UPI0034625B65
MTAKDTNFTFGEESTTWLTYALENFPSFMLFPLGLLMTLMIIYSSVITGLFVFYIGGSFIYICKKIGNLPDDPDSEQWRKPQQIHAFMVSTLAKLLHGYEICGMDNIPKGPAVLIYYHGSMPADYFFFVTTLYRRTGRLCRSVIDRFFFLLPGLKTYIITEGCGHLNREECVALLKKGHVVGIAPGGLREQNYGDNNYKLIWGNRQGFAHIAMEAKVPVIPVFTQNIREAYRVFGNLGPMRWFYERTRLLVFPVLGPFPVKLRTHVGEPIPYDPNISPAELFEKVKAAVEALRDKHQKIPGSILSALWERFEVHHKEE